MFKFKYFCEEVVRFRKMMGDKAWMNAKKIDKMNNAIGSLFYVSCNVRGNKKTQERVNTLYQSTFDEFCQRKALLFLV